MPGKGKGGRGKSGASNKAISRSSRAGLQFPVGRIASGGVLPNIHSTLLPKKGTEEGKVEPANA